MFGFAGAEAFVAQYGQHTIQRAVRDYYEGDRRAIRNPAGFIRWLVEQRHRPKP
ncbi:MAG: hypothetical protein QME71_04195 [Dehalococcoidia bacterium]|nr:hypothetical protein [Dehalococcoidia bacterium]